MAPASFSSKEADWTTITRTGWKLMRQELFKMDLWHFRFGIFGNPAVLQGQFSRWAFNMEIMRGELSGIYQYWVKWKLKPWLMAIVLQKGTLNFAVPRQQANMDDNFRGKALLLREIKLVKKLLLFFLICWLKWIETVCFLPCCPLQTASSSWSACYK